MDVCSGLPDRTFWNRVPGQQNVSSYVGFGFGTELQSSAGTAITCVSWGRVGVLVVYLSFYSD